MLKHFWKGIIAIFVAVQVFKSKKERKKTVMISYRQEPGGISKQVWMAPPKKYIKAWLFTSVRKSSHTENSEDRQTNGGGTSLGLGSKRRVKCEARRKQAQG